MSPDLSTRVRSYAAQLEQDVPHVTVAEIEQRLTDATVEPEGDARRQIPGWAVAIAAAAVVLVIVGVLPWLLRSPGVNEPTAPSPSTSVSTSEATQPETPVTTMPTTTVATVTELSVPQPDLSARAWASIPATTELFSDGTVWDVTAFGTGMVAVGIAYPDGRIDAAAWSSPDGLAWSRVPHDEEIFGGGWMWAIQSDGERLVAVGQSCDEVVDLNQQICSSPPTPTVWTSVDGSSWQRIAHDPTVFGLDGTMTDLVAYENGWLSVGSSCDDDTSCSAAAWSSPDGISWTRTLLPDIGDTQLSVARGNGLFVIVTHGEGSEVWTSSDGVEWLRVEHDPALFDTGGPTDEFWSAHMESVTYGCFDQASCRFIAVGSVSGNDDQRARIWTSTDGSTWTVAFEGPADSGALDVAADGDTIVAVGSAIWRTVDGVTWVQVANPEPYQLSWAVAAGTTNWVSVPGESHPIWVSPPPN